MRFAFVLFVVALLATPLAPSAWAQATPSGPPTIEELTAEGRIHGVEVSPSGRYLAIVRHTDLRDFIQVIDLETRSQSVVTLDVVALDKATTSMPFKAFSIRDVHWKGDDRLVYFYYRYRLGNVGRGPAKRPAIIGEGGVTAIRRDGSEPIRIRATAVIDWLDSDPNRFVVRGFQDLLVGKGATAIAVDLSTGQQTQLDAGVNETISWASDRSGRLILRYDRIGRRGGLRVMQRDTAGDWTELFALREKDFQSMPELEVVRASDDPTKIFVAVTAEVGAENDSRQLRLYDLVAKTMGPVLMTVPGYDFDAVSFHEKTGDVIGLCYWKDAYVCDLKDPEARKDYEAMVARFGPERSVYMHSASDDRSIQVVFVSGPTDPGSFHVYDRRTGKVESLGNQQPALKGDRLATANPFEWKGRDGVSLFGYVTTPRTAVGKAPLVVMPHGGPESRDRLAYDRWAQAFAARGYVVFQPNFRGSGGFGRRFAEMGYGQWGLKMQDDVMDGVQALIDSGKVDPDRVCIVGASYGGYVSLYAGARHPERFKCVVSFAGVSDLVASQEWERSESGVDSPRYRYWLKSIGDPVADADRLVATSPITYAADYGPPVLLIHGIEDDIVPINQSRAMERALKRAGKSVRLIEVGFEGHSGWSVENETKALAEMVAFVDAAIGTPK